MTAAEDSGKARLEALGALIRARRVSEGRSLRDVAARTGVSNAYLSQVERGLHEPSLSVLRAITDALGLPLESLLARAGLLGGGGDTASTAAPERGTEAAILADPELSEPQRFALLSIYRSFVPPGRRA